MSPTNLVRKKRVLVADNFHTLRSVIQRYLEDDFDIVEAGTGEEVFSHLADSRPGEIFMAIVSMEFSDINGFQIVAKIREKFDAEALPVIFNTSSNKKELILRALKVGCNDYIVKPFSKELLLSKVRKLAVNIPVKNLEMSKEIAKIPFFHGVPESQVASALNSCSETAIFEPGDKLSTQGEDNHDIFILMEGRCEVLLDNKRVSEIVPVETVGEIGFLEETPRSATVKALERSRVITLKKNLFDDFLNMDRAISEIICKNVVHTLSTRIKQSNELIRALKVLSS